MGNPIVKMIEAEMAISDCDVNTTEDVIRRVFAALETAGYRVVLEKHWTAALYALKSYEYGNGSPDLAKAVGDTLANVTTSGQNTT